MTIEHLHDGPRMNQVVVYNGMAYLSGQTAGDAGAWPCKATWP